MVDWLTILGELVHGALEQSLLKVSRHVRDENHKAGVYRLVGVEPPEIGSIVCNENKIVLASVAQDIPILPPRLANMRYVMRLVPRIGCDAYEFNTETLVDQEPHGG